MRSMQTLQLSRSRTTCVPLRCLEVLSINLLCNRCDSTIKVRAAFAAQFTCHCIVHLVQTWVGVVCIQAMPAMLILPETHPFASLQHRRRCTAVCITNSKFASASLTRAMKRSECRHQDYVTDLRNTLHFLIVSSITCCAPHSLPHSLASTIFVLSLVTALHQLDNLVRVGRTD